MMRDEIAPAVRELGFKGSGQSCSLPSEDYWALIGFQKSDVSSSSAVKFTVNLTVVSKEGWRAGAPEAEPWIGERPKPNISTGIGGGWSERIGGLSLHRKLDLWWCVQLDTPTVHVSREVVSAIRDFGLQRCGDGWPRGSAPRQDSAWGRERPLPIQP